MQELCCPFCGPRDETEFHFAGEAGVLRPAPAAEVGDEDWAAYLYLRANAKGLSREIWQHLACGELFLLERDSLSHVVLKVEPLSDDAPS